MRVELTIDIPCKEETKRLECITKNIKKLVQYAQSKKRG